MSWFHSYKVQMAIGAFRASNGPGSEPNDWNAWLRRVFQNLDSDEGRAQYYHRVPRYIPANRDEGLDHGRFLIYLLRSARVRW
jgi:hypothetical protein